MTVLRDEQRTRVPALILAALAAILAAITLVSYLAPLPAWLQIGGQTATMSLLTATAILCMAATVVALDRHLTGT